MSLALRSLTKTYPAARRTDPVPALSSVTFEADSGELVVIVGPSGSGKSTLLRCVAGLEEPDSGSILVGGRDVTSLPPGDRNVAMVFQEHTLYPHLTVRDNIAFGLKARQTSKEELRARTKQASALLELDGVLERRPSQLSGGEQQRVALARAIVREPAAFLMDEPLSDLDAELRTFMRAEIHALQRRLATTTIYVTHDQTEAMTMGDRVVVLRGGRIEQIASPTELYDHPANTFVARFIGNPAMNVFPGGVVGATGNGVIGIRPESLRLVPAGRVRGRVTHLETIGHEVIVHVLVGDETLLARAPRDEAPGLHSTTGIDFYDDAVHRFDAEGRAL